ncbi:hypothetical protein IMAU20120_02613 [Lactiplantibacillus plantarum]|uniref:hypothetical protein n=1 Tax=Lactiplantibacillus plantarum TaxID=1590 RepID=UPI002469131F|nr:hypothetical protein [Lactiplantibacillus plantarum]MCG0638298.1 hypothetical protein [Lactiplantibacillus plantarum]MCG0665665.1 hypothetical protein [Lactiplantibacillus plantarum]MCG0813734.1 hypothetical protein [Lactiplantibacillus plantarum]MCG0864075.1 hypothetical protein [Lactiplantibacillus plantarum]MCG0879069.1 hypothetical protein [Lactiplantibacillus plantarum]
MKLAYQYDTDGLLVATVYLEDKDPIPASCTAVVPNTNLKTKPKWDGKTWIESEQVYAITPEVKIPNSSQQMIAKLGADIAQMQQMITKLATMIKPQGGQHNE